MTTNRPAGGRAVAESFSVRRATRTDDAAQIARFAASIMAADPDYISHGEIRTGRSPDGRTWAPDLVARLEAEISNAILGADARRDVFVARTGAGVLIAAALVYWGDEGAGGFCMFEDLIVSPDWRRKGVGARLVATVEESAATKGVNWMWLESGLNNEGAHEFFSRLGYASRSKTFGKRLKN